MSKRTDYRHGEAYHRECSELREEIYKYLGLVAKMELLLIEDIDVGGHEEGSHVFGDRLDSDVNDTHDNVSRDLSEKAIPKHGYIVHVSYRRSIALSDVTQVVC